MNAFIRSLKSLEGDGAGYSTAGLAASALLMAAWGCWSSFTEVKLHAVTPKARLEVDNAITPLQTPAAGRVVVTRLAVGKKVKAGDVLVEIDTRGERLRVGEAESKISSLGMNLQAVLAEIAAEERAGEQERRATAVAIEEKRAHIRETEASAKFAEEDAARTNELRRSGLISERETKRSGAEAQKLRAVAESEQIAMRRMEQEQRTRDSERATRLRRLQGELARLEGEKQDWRAKTDTLRYEVERRVVRAPIGGTIGEAAKLREGAYVNEGEKVGAIVPDGVIAVVAEFPPAAAMGRIKTGQPALVRLEGYSWTQFGSLKARVKRVASEVREGTVRVELALEGERNPAIPVEHGLPGSVEIEVEKITPYRLLMRAAGKWITAEKDPFLRAGTAGADQTKRP